MQISGIILLADCYGPSFQVPFPPTFTFSNSSGGILDCQVGGEPPPPATTWVTQEGTTLSSYPGVLSLLPNGSLRYHKFSAERWRSDIHDTYIRCQSTNVYGTVISTLIHVKGGKHLHLLISFLLLKMQTSKTSDCESTLYTRSNNPTNFNAGIKQTNW